MKHIFLLSFFLIALVFGNFVKGKKSFSNQLNFSNFELSGGDKPFFARSPTGIIHSFNLHALPKSTVNIEFECNFMVGSSLYELKLELKKSDSEKWELEEYEIEKDEGSSEEVSFSETEILEGPYSGFRNCYKSIVEKNHEAFLKYQTQKTKIRVSEERFLDLISDEARDRDKDGYSELEVIANSLPAKDPEIKGATRIEIEFEYLCEIKSKKGIMKVDYECLREANNPKVWAISDADADFKEF